MLSARAKGKADFALIAQGRKVMKRPEGNTKDLKITLVIWSKSADEHCPTSGKSAKGADKHLDEELHTQGFEPVIYCFPACPEDWGRSLTTPVLPSSVESVCPWRVAIDQSFRELLALVSGIYMRV